MDLNNFQFRNFIKSLEGVFDKDNLKKLSIYFFSSTSLIIVFYILFYLIFAPTERDYLSMEENKNNVIKTESSIENIIVAIKKLKPFMKSSLLYFTIKMKLKNFIEA